MTLAAQGMEALGPQMKAMFDMAEVEFHFFKEKCLKKIADSQETMISELAGLYDRNFSEEEIEQWVAFLTSPVGNKISRIQPALNQEFLGIVGQHTQRYIQEVAVEEEKEEGK